MGMPRQIQEAALQIIDNANDIHGALALAGRHELTAKIVRIQKSAACILKAERLGVNPLESARQDLLNAVNALYHVIQRNIIGDDRFSEEELVTIIRTANVLTNRGYAYMDMLVNGEEEESQVSPAWTKTSVAGGQYEECQGCPEACDGCHCPAA
jgi:hypothetical protein